VSGRSGRVRLPAPRAAAVLGSAVLTAPAVAIGGVARAGLLARVPVEPDRSTARGWAAAELAGREYQSARPGLVQRALTALRDWLSGLQPNLPGGTGPRIAVLVTLFVLVAAVLYAVQRGGGLRRQARGGRNGVFAGAERTAADHRAAAEAAERAQDWATAVLEWFRAITRELEERAVLVPQPGRTADEVARDAGGWLPALAPSLATGAVLFDEVRYGDRPASAGAAGRLRDLDEQVRRARPAATAVPAAADLVAPS
jgi:hypothetical protein